MIDLAESIEGLATLSPAQLRYEWRRLHRGKPMPDGMSSDLLARSIAWRLQERRAGGHSSVTVRKLDRWANQVANTGEIELERKRPLKLGTRLVRQWHGEVHTVTVVENGYEYRGRHFASLTHIARDITGAVWSGPRFFGLRSRGGKTNAPQA